MLATALALTLLLATPSKAGGGVEVWSADSIGWSETRPGGTQRTFLKGDPKQAGALVSYAFHLPAGTWFPAHVHPTAARVFVMKGVLLLGEGIDGNDHVHVRRVAAGQAVLVPADLPHYEGAEEDTVILGVAPGPFETHFLSAQPRLPKARHPARRCAEHPLCTRSSAG